MVSTNTSVPDTPAEQQTDEMVGGSGSYELLKKRLAAHGDALLSRTQALNAARVAEFGRNEQSLILRTRARTENNCVARDIVRIGDRLLFGYNVFIGLRKETAVGDVFALYRLAESGAGDELEALPLAGSFLEDQRFVSDFRELHAYYKQATLIQLRVTQDKLLAAFQIGQQLHDLRVFRWSLENDGELRYIDNRGERDMALPPSHDFEWTPTRREDQVGGRHPHINILDTVFVETVGGDLTVKIENNTESGLGIYSEPVEDKTQSLADAEIAYARLGLLILLRIKPYREQTVRYLVYNTRTQSVTRIDAIGVSCIQLPEDHGIIFPGGYYLQSGEHKRFDLPEAMLDKLRFKRVLRSPNGEDVLYIFYQPGLGHYALFTYNLIDKTLGAPILGNGYARFPDGRILVFQADGGEPTRVHPMQLWQTPFSSDEHAGKQAAGQGFFGRIGNADLVRGISELNAIARAVREQVPTRTAYEDLIRQCGRAQDAYFWIAEPEAGGLGDELRAIADGARLTLAEFEKVDSIRRETAQALAAAEAEQRELVNRIAGMLWRSSDEFVSALNLLRERRGHLQTLKELRYADLPRIEAMDQALADEQHRVGQRAMQFLAAADAFAGQRQLLDGLAARIPQAASAQALEQILGELDSIAAGLDLLSEQLGGLPGGDAVLRTDILDRISALYAETNRLRAEARNRRRNLGSAEAAAEFGAQFKLFGQTVESALEFADTPEKCDEALTRLLARLEELEGRFAEQDNFLADIASQREAVYEALSARRQSLLDARQRRVRSLNEAGARILDGIPRRVAKFQEIAEVHAYFAADPLIGKLQKLVDDLRALGDGVAADDLDTRIKTARDQALRSVRDRRELLSDDGNTLRFGRHAFTVSQQALDLTLVPRDNALAWHLTGTDYYDAVDDSRLAAYRAFWEQPLVSETPALARAEYLAGSLLYAALNGLPDGPAWTELQQAAAGDPPTLPALVRQHAATRYREGYQKGIHDDDAARLLGALIRMQDEAGLLAWSPQQRVLALLYWQHGCFVGEREALLRQARSALQLQQRFAAGDALSRLEAATAEALLRFARDFLPASEETASEQLTVRCAQAAAYLIRQLASARTDAGWVIAGAADDLADALVKELERTQQLTDWQRDLDSAEPAERWQLARAWVAAFAAAQHAGAADWIDDAAGRLAVALPRQRINADLALSIDGLRSEHPRIIDGRLGLNLNDFWQRFHDHRSRIVPAFEQFHQLRHELLGAEKARLGLAQFQAKPLSTFVRNRLIDEVYLPLLGDNLAKQLGTAGAGNRTDRMGLLLLISPPGYGKTTLMEYVADRLGLVFVRINCPVLGHDVTALDPAAAAHGAARQELEKLNLGLAMGSNVMLYLDDIQHTSPEFLQKFIALADGTRRIEGVWKGEARTYDMRGKRFAVVMAGNPYTESGDVFKIPDMLANRADIYNLGDVLDGREALFALSYIENSLTANPALLPLASRDPKDVQLLVRLAEGEEIPGSAFSHPYSALEQEELVALMRRLFRIRDLLLKVNLAYIESAAQKDAYRSEPPFKLQGSYRNMTKLAGKVTAIMRDGEIDALLRDHYRGEAQTLTTGAEENLLKLAELLGTPGADEQARWTAIKEAFVRQRKLGGDDSDPGTRIAASLLDVARAVDGLKPDNALADRLGDGLERIEAGLRAVKPSVHVEAGDLSQFAGVVGDMVKAYEKVLLPLVTATYHKIRLDHSMWDEMKRVSSYLDKLEKEAGNNPPPEKPKPRSKA
ncbi:DNA repair ATPase [Azonexus sp.]|uniref:DNA repair ATPase n=1 Tax=Azonexus sp. TaxID=1872668 RepID=UPI0035B4633B